MSRHRNRPRPAPPQVVAGLNRSRSRQPVSPAATPRPPEPPTLYTGLAAAIRSPGGPLEVYRQAAAAPPRSRPSVDLLQGISRRHHRDLQNAIAKAGIRAGTDYNPHDPDHLSGKIAMMAGIVRLGLVTWGAAAKYEMLNRSARIDPITASEWRAATRAMDDDALRSFADAPFGTGTGGTGKAQRSIIDLTSRAQDRSYATILRQGDVLAQHYRTQGTDAAAAYLRNLSQRTTLPTTAEATRELSTLIGLSPGDVGTIERKRLELQRLGLTPADINRQVDALAGRMVEQRASTVARTELASALNAAKHDRYDQLVDDGAVSDTDVVRTWEAQPDACDRCAEADGSTVRGLTTMFHVGGRALRHPPVHPNCECSVTITRVRRRPR